MVPYNPLSFCDCRFSGDLMATATARFDAQRATAPDRRYDHYFFSFIAAMMLVVVVAGFGPSYYFAGVFRSPLPSTIIHVRGAVFSGWMLLLIAQTLRQRRGSRAHKRMQRGPSTLFGNYSGTFSPKNLSTLST